MSFIENQEKKESTLRRTVEDVKGFKISVVVVCVLCVALHKDLWKGMDVGWCIHYWVSEETCV